MLTKSSIVTDRVRCNMIWYNKLTQLMNSCIGIETFIVAYFALIHADLKKSVKKKLSKSRLCSSYLHNCKSASRSVIYEVPNSWWRMAKGYLVRSHWQFSQQYVTFLLTKMTISLILVSHPIKLWFVCALIEGKQSYKVLQVTWYVWIVWSH